MGISIEDTNALGIGFYRCMSRLSSRDLVIVAQALGASFESWRGDETYDDLRQLLLDHLQAEGQPPANHGILD